MRRFLVLAILSMLSACGHNNVVIEDYETDKGIKLSIPSSLFKTYHGPKKAFSLKMKYPSMKSLDFFGGKHERWVYLLFNNRGISDPLKTIEYLHPSCVSHPREGIDTLVDLDSEGIFNVSRMKSPGMSNGVLYYIPAQRIEGLHCITCIENTTCSMLAIDETGLSYRATSNQPNFVEEWKAVKASVEGFIGNHVVN